MAMSDDKLKPARSGDRPPGHRRPRSWAGNGQRERDEQRGAQTAVSRPWTSKPVLRVRVRAGRSASIRHPTPQLDPIRAEAGHDKLDTLCTATVSYMESVIRLPGESKDAANAAEQVRAKRLREDARRPMSVNLAEGIALSHQLMQFTGAARRS
jgi:hypothetical protein